MVKTFHAHRGYSSVAPENTYLAFEAAVIYGFDAVEFDVHLTKDHHLVIVHDETINRTSDKKGEVQNMTLDQLGEADFGKKFKVKGLPKQTIMTLDQFLTEFGSRFKLINIELKTDVIPYPGIEQKVVDVLQKHQRISSEIVLSCFNFDSLKILHNINPKLKLGFLWWKHREFKKIGAQQIKKYCQYLHPSWQTYSNMRWQEEYQSLGLKFNLWTVNSQRTLNRFRDDPFVEGIIGNYRLT